MNKWRMVCKFLVLFVLLNILILPVHSQKENRVWVGIPLWASAQLPIDAGVLDHVLANTDSILRRTDMNIALQIMFPLSRTVSFGPEIGVAYPPVLLVNAVENRSTDGLLTSTLHIPLRLVLNIALGDNFSLETFVGTNINIWQIDTTNLRALVFDAGIRLDINNFIIHTAYTLPYTVDLSRIQDASQTSVWSNNINFGLGYRFEL